MEEVVGIRIVDARRGEVGLLSWGRLYDSVDPAPLLTRIREVLRSMGFRDISELSLCSELAELRDFQYFYEGIVYFAAAYAGQMSRYKDLSSLTQDADSLRKSLYLLGPRRS